MSRTLRITLWAAVSIPAVASIVYAALTGEEVATVVLSVPVLIISAATLALTVPKPAELVVIRQDELDVPDLIFFTPAEGGIQPVDVPRDYLLQLHVAVCNVGNRKAVLSHIEVDRFYDDRGRPIAIPELPRRVRGHRWTQRFGYINAQPQTEGMEIAPPFVLESDDVITIRFRERRGIDWTQRWDLEALKQYHAQIRPTIAKARVRVAWRRGTALIETTTIVSMRVERQEEYVNSIRAVTEEFTVRPKMREQSVLG